MTIATIAGILMAVAALAKALGLDETPDSPEPKPTVEAATAATS